MCAAVARHRGASCDGFTVCDRVLRANVRSFAVWRFDSLLQYQFMHASQSATATIRIRNRLGLHARPAMSFVDTANGFDCEIHVRKGDQVVDGKSIMQMMMLAATQGTELQLLADGPDADAALSALTELVERKFDED